MVDEGVWWSKECGGAESEVGYVSVEGVGLLGHESLHTVETLSLSPSTLSFHDCKTSI